MLPASASARDLSEVPSGLTELRTTAHFKVHYTTTAGSKHAISDFKAKKVGTRLEWARTRDQSLDFTGVVDDGDHHTDVYVYDIPGDLKAFSKDDVQDVPTTSAWMGVDKASALSKVVLSHEFFHVLQSNVFQRVPQSKFLHEATAVWASARATNTLSDHQPQHIGKKGRGRSLECPKDQCPAAGPYRGWPFFEFLSEHYGLATVHRIFERMRIIDNQGFPPNQITAIEQTLSEKGTSIENVMVQYARANGLGAYTFGPLKNRKATVENGTLVPKLTAPVSRSLTLNHLSARFLHFTGGCAGCRIKIKATSPSPHLQFELLRGNGDANLPVGGVIDRTWAPGSKGTLSVVSTDPANDGMSVSVAAKVSQH